MAKWAVPNRLKAASRQKPLVADSIAAPLDPEAQRVTSFLARWRGMKHVGARETELEAH